MLKIKKGVYIYAQIKIDGNVKDFYVGNINNIDSREASFALDTKLVTYLDNRDLKHKFRNHRTLIGKFRSELEDLKEKVLEP